MLSVLVRILRGSPGSYITIDIIKSINLELKRDLRFPGVMHQAADDRLEQLWRMLADVGIGAVKLDAANRKYLHKFARSSLSQNTILSLEENRLLGYMSGMGPAFDRNARQATEQSVRGTNP